MEQILRYRKALLWGLVAITLFFGWNLFKLEINFSFESFYARSDPEFQYYESHRQLFDETQNYMLCLALKSPGPDIFDARFLRQADSLFEEIRGLPRIDSALLATQFGEIRRSGLGYRMRPYLQFTSQEAVERSRRRVLADSNLSGNFVSPDLRYLYGYFFMDGEIFDKSERDQLNEQIEAVLAHSGMEYVLTGIPYIRTQYIRKIGSELLLFLSLSALLIISVLFFTYRNFWGVVIPMLAVLVALIWVLGLMGATGESINLISNLLIPIIFVVGTSDVIHLITKYISEMREGTPKEVALSKTLREIGFAIFLTSLTTAIGFASLMVSRLPPIRSFGLYAAIGVMFTFVIAFIIMPAALYRIPASGFMHQKALGNLRFWHGMLMGIYRLTRTKSRQILLTSALVLGACVLLIFQIPTDTYLIEDLGSEDPVRQDMVFFEQQSYGIRPFEIGIHAKNGHQITEKAVLEELKKLQDFIRSRQHFGPFLSVVTLVEQANYTKNFNLKKHQRLPDTQVEIDELLTLAELRGGQQLLNNLMSADRTRARLSSRVPDIGTDAFEHIYADIDSFYHHHLDTTLFTYRFTGHAFLTENNLSYLRNSLMLGLLIAFIVIGVIMGLLFRSWRMLCISMLPNVVPLILTGGVMGLFGITLTASTAIVFVVAFGIAVDDTIHFLMRYRLEKQKGHHIDAAIRNTMLGTGKAMLLTSLVLLGGFGVLIASDFGGTFNTGLFTALTIVFALLADLFLLPILLRWLEP
ncbi:MAG: hypothetical protein D6730_04240 [Bacteroidetes bacterium]|nr:MAG: hypothetical protein D6730_04240 [Bacteroidota bacterium]